ncbi:hypothetical protein L7F22_060818 [Adiantum nelumboides]|nr:hypothetical protein [Adiantum nelumboides]
MQQQAGGQGPNGQVPRRPPRRDYQYHNYGEDEQDMYFCPYPRVYGNAPPSGPQQQVSPLRMRPPPMPMCEQQQQPQQQQPIQILRQSTYALVPQPTAKVPPLPHDGVERATNVISCEDKGEEKIMEAEAMPGKQATVAKEPSRMTTDDGANKKEKKRKKRVSVMRRNIGITNFPIGVKSYPYDLIEDVEGQGSKFNWPQLLHLFPGMRQQWSKMMSTRRSKNVNTLKAQLLEDDVPTLDTQLKGQRVSRYYVEGGAQMCIISEKMMHKLRLEVSGPSGFKGNDVSVKYVGGSDSVWDSSWCKHVCAVAKGEGYPIILGRPWLIAMNARQNWESRTLLLKPPGKKGKSVQTIVYNMKEGRRERLELETSKDEWSTKDSSSTTEVTSSVSDNESAEASSLEVIDVVLTRPTTKDGGSIKETLSDEKIEGMLSTDLSKKEREEFKVTLRKNSPLFILDCKQIKGSTMVEHQINLKPESNPIAQKLHSFSTCAPILANVESLKVDLHGLKASSLENKALIAKKEVEIGVLTRVLSMNAGFNYAARMKEEMFAMQATVHGMDKVPSEFRRQASFMKGSSKVMKREGRAILVPNPPFKFALYVDTIIIGGNCVACGQELSGKHVVGVFQLSYVHKYHLVCFSMVSVIEPKCVVLGCKWKIPHIARCWVFGNVYEEPEDELVVDKECVPRASTSFTHTVDEVFDIDAMLIEHKNFEGVKPIEGGDGEILKETTPSASKQVAEIEDLEMESTLQFVAVELLKKRKKQVEDELSP